jgi:hypothetical protein
MTRTSERNSHPLKPANEHNRSGRNQGLSCFKERKEGYPFSPIFLQNNNTIKGEGVS